MTEKDNEQLTIEGAHRAEGGKGFNRKLRKQGLIPGSLMKDRKPLAIQLNPKLLSKAWQNGKKFLLKLKKYQK